MPSVCLYTPSVDPSGMGTHMLDLIRAWPAGQATLMCRPTDGGRRLLEAARALGAQVLPLPGPRDPAFCEAVTSFLRSSPADVFHCHVGIGWEGWDGVRAARLAGVLAVVQTQHLPFALASRRKRAAYLRSLVGVDRLVAVSDGVRASYVRLGVPDERFVTIPNGVRLRAGGMGRYAARRALGLPAGGPVVMTVGRLTHMKGQRDLVDAVPALRVRFPSLTVVVVGGGPLQAELASRAESLGVSDAVRLAGHRPDARGLLDAADVFALPSRHEGMPLAALEAMAARLPVVATDVVGTREVVVHGATGLLVPPRDPEALGEALAQLLADPPTAARLGAAGHRRYEEAFTAERMAARTAATYLTVLASSRSPSPTAS